MTSMIAEPLALQPADLWYEAADVTCGDVVYHNRRVAQAMLPHVERRPVLFEPFGGIGRAGRLHVPDPLRTVVDGRVFGACNELATLIRMATDACIGLHAASCRLDQPEHPDRLLFDLDGPEREFAPTAEAALRLRDLLDELSLPSWVMLTGSRGVHVAVPLGRKYSYEQALSFARDVACVLVSRCEGVALAGDARSAVVRVDVGRNAAGAVSVVPWSIRPVASAAVAVPIPWDEIGRRGMHPQRFSTWDALDRLDRAGDPWLGMGRHGRALREPQRRLARLVEALSEPKRTSRRAKAASEPAPMTRTGRRVA